MINIHWLWLLVAFLIGLTFGIVICAYRIGTNK